MPNLKPAAIAGALLLSLSGTIAHAALEQPAEYIEVADIGQIGFNDTMGSVACIPPETQYIPSFIRAPDGTIVGVDYLIIDYVC